MNWIESLFIVAGISLDIFAAMECQGSLIDKINKKQLGAVCLLIAAFQLAALYLGHFLSSMFCRRHPASNERLLGEIISMVIFMGLGIRLMVKAVKNEHVEEHLEKNPDIRRFVPIALVSSLYTVMAGVAFGFLNTNVVPILLLLAAITIVFVIAGTYTGLQLGFAAKTKVYAAGAVILWATGLDVLIRKILGG